MRTALAALLGSILFTACVNKPEDYRPAGFESDAQAREYVGDYLYYAKKLSAREWDEFYERFPAYWKDKQQAKNMGATGEFHPWYTAYAFRWTTLRRKLGWNPDTLSRLDRNEISPGDDVFKVVYALGPARRVVWDNDFEILTYAPGLAMLFRNGIYERSEQCPGCNIRFDAANREGMQDSEVISILKLTRPKY